MAETISGSAITPSTPIPDVAAPQALKECLRKKNIRTVGDYVNKVKEPQFDGAFWEGIIIHHINKMNALCLRNDLLTEQELEASTAWSYIRDGNELRHNRYSDSAHRRWETEPASKQSGPRKGVSHIKRGSKPDSQAR